MNATCTKPGCDRPHVAKGLCGTHYSQKRRSTPRHEYICDQCGETFVVGRKKYTERVFCGRSCQAVWLNQNTVEARMKNRYNARSKELALWIKPPAKVQTIPEPQKQSAPWKACTCEICGEAFLSKQFDRTCSGPCYELRRRRKRREAKDRRRAVKKSAYVSNVNRDVIFARDDYRCRLCGKRLNMHAKVPQPDAPTIDHIIPLSIGGTHEPANVQSAHFSCNVRKGNRGAGEQLALIG